MSDDEKLEGAAEAIEPKSYDLTVVRWEGRIRCVYLNNYRIAGSKPWGGGDTAAEWSIGIRDLRDAVPEVNQAFAEVDRLKYRVAALEEAAKPLAAAIADYAPSAGEDDDEVVEIALRDLRHLRASLPKEPA